MRSAYKPIMELAAEATAVALGPGLGRSDELMELVGKLYREIKAPMVVDADALNALAQHRATIPHAGGPRILTPHPGEFDRLVGQKGLGADKHRPRRSPSRGSRAPSSCSKVMGR